MPSSGKTKYLGLNQWVETDCPQMADFNRDNKNIDDALGGQISPPYIGEDGYWYVFDLSTRAYVKTEYQSRGEPGPAGPEGPTGPQGPSGPPLQIAGSYPSEEALNEAFPTGDGDNSYLVDGYIYVWDGTVWVKTVLSDGGGSLPDDVVTFSPDGQPLPTPPEPAPSGGGDADTLGGHPPDYFATAAGLEAAQEAIAGINEALPGFATSEMVAEALSGTFVSGGYEGNDANPRTIDLGFQPKLVLIFALEQPVAYNQAGGNYIFSAIICPEGGTVGSEMTATGFTVYNASAMPPTGIAPMLNSTGASYRYFAIK